MLRSRAKAHHAAWIVLAMSLLLEGTAYAGDYWGKPLRYLFLDALILTSPVTGLMAVFAASNPRWCERPHDWRTSKAIPGFAYRWLIRHTVALTVCSALCALGLFTLFLHLMSVV